MQSNMAYKWKIPKYPVEAQVAGEELMRISKSRGRLTPYDVVDESRAEGTVLHNCFEWDDEAAAEEYRKEQARDILQNVVTVVVNNVPQPTPIRAFVNISSDYKPLPVVLEVKEFRDEMYRKALAELGYFKSKYADLEQLSGVFKEIDKLGA